MRKNIEEHSIIITTTPFGLNRPLLTRHTPPSLWYSNYVIFGGFCTEKRVETMLDEWDVMIHN
jgi:hypothetical protein